MDKQLCCQAEPQKKEDACTQLQNMIEDCLLEVFSVKSLQLMDLCCLADTCKRFRSITQRVIGKKLALDAVDRAYEFNTDKFYYKDGTQSDVERLLRNFGPCLSVLRIKCATVLRHSFLLNLVKRYCGEELKHLSICNFHIPATLMKELKAVFRRLHKFELITFAINGDKSLFSGLYSLVELKVIDVSNCNAVLENVFPQLERFTYCSPDEIFETYQDDPCLETMLAFIKSHTKLKVLDITILCEEKSGRNIVQAIGNSCTVLQELSLWLSCVDITRTSLKPLQALRSLQTLKLCEMPLEDSDVFAPLTKLCVLELELCHLPLYVDQFACLSRLTRLDLIYCKSIRTYDVGDIVQQLGNLVQLKVMTHSLVLDATLYSKIVSIVKGRSNALTLICRCDATVKSDRGQNVKLIRLDEDRDWSQ